MLGGGGQLGKELVVLSRALVDRPLSSAADLAGSGPRPFPDLVSGKMGSGTHPPMLPSASGF